MKKQETLITQKRRGPPPTGKGELIGVRLQPDLLARLDAWREERSEEPTRPEAIRQLVERGLEGEKRPRKRS